MLSWYITTLEGHSSLYVQLNFVLHREHSVSIIKTSLLILCMDIIVTVSNNTGNFAYNVPLRRVLATTVVVEKQ